MAYINTPNERRLFVDRTNPDDPIGIALWEIYDCLRYTKVDKRGEPSLNLVLEKGDFNRWAKHKPFRYGKWNFATEEEREDARKEMHQGLNIPTAANAGITSTRGKTFLGELAYRALSVAGTPNWEYLGPRGVDNIYFEPFRLPDIDGYNHLAKQPFDTKGSINNSGTMMLLPPAGNTEIKVNRFVSTGLRFTLQMNNTNVDISMADLLYGSDSDFYFFVAEKYVDTNLGGNTDYYQRDPNEVLKAPTSIAEIPQHGGSSIIDYTLEAKNDNKQIKFVVGVNEYTSNAADADIQTRGYGFIAPYAPPSNIPFLYTIRQEYYGVFDMRQQNGYYLPSLNGGFQSFSLKDYDDLTMKGTESDKVGISLLIRKRADNYYITGSKAYSVPSGKVNYKFRLINQGGATVVGTLTDATMTQDLTHAVIPMGSNNEYETVYIRFDNFLPNRGDSVTYGILEVSNDNGQTWTQISSSAMGDGYIESGCDGSSIKLYLTRK